VEREGATLLNVTRIAHYRSHQHVQHLAHNQLAQMVRNRRRASEDHRGCHQGQGEELIHQSARQFAQIKGSHVHCYFAAQPWKFAVINPSVCNVIRAAHMKSTHGCTLCARPYTLSHSHNLMAIKVSSVVRKEYNHHLSEGRVHMTDRQRSHTLTHSLKHSHSQNTKHTHTHPRGSARRSSSTVSSSGCNISVQTQIAN
jgi:hypothetical protein